MAIQVVKAQRKSIKVKLALTGPTGSGKTLSGLLLAKGLGEKIGCIDTENGSASLYSDRLDFDVCNISAPFTTEKYIEALQYFVKEKYDVVLIDSITHAWSGQGGLLDQKQQLDQRGGSGFNNWARITSKHEAFKAALMQSPIHVIASMRSKMEYAQVQGDNGKTQIKKLGLAPEQRDGIEYDFSVVFDIAMNHEAEASKDRTGIFGDSIFKINEEVGHKIKDWLSTAKSEPQQVVGQTTPQQQPQENKNVQNQTPRNTQQPVAKNNPKQETKPAVGNTATTAKVKNHAPDQNQIQASKSGAKTETPRPAKLPPERPTEAPATATETVNDESFPESLTSASDTSLDENFIDNEMKEAIIQHGANHGWDPDDIGHLIYSKFRLLGWSKVQIKHYNEIWLAIEKKDG